MNLRKNRSIDPQRLEKRKEQLKNSSALAERKWPSILSALVIAMVWLWTGLGLASRFHFVNTYQVIAALPIELEPFGAPMSCTIFLLALSLLWPSILWLNYHRFDLAQLARLRKLLAIQAIACLPIAYSFARTYLVSGYSPSVWETIWFAGFSGLFAKKLIDHWKFSWEPSESGARALLTGICILFGLSWYFQSIQYFSAFRLGFNDAGHFTQRIANTVAGRGLLLESPVLPTFWDHFNPGLLLLTPLWLAMPDVRTLFIVQPLAVTISALIVMRIARVQGFNNVSSIAWALGWLLFPVIGQINLAYSYGWHPVILGIPFLLYAYLAWQSDRRVLAVISMLIGWSFEEGLIVITGCFAGSMALRSYLSPSLSTPADAIGPGAGQTRRWSSTLRWLSVWGCSVVCFVIVYRFSGLAEFQVGRFARLGGSTLEVIASPLLKPGIFWGLILRAGNLPFFVIWFLPGLVSQGWRTPWAWLAMLLPFSVLLFWEHQPAQSIAFQYTAALVPLLILGCMESQRERMPIEATAELESSSRPIGFALTACILSLFVGQFPWSQDSYLDLETRNYGIQEENRRVFGEPDNLWIHETIKRFKPVRDKSVLATGRIAMHFVGAKDVETVGQYWQREKMLAAHHSDLASPLLAYELLFLDTIETFQQSPDETRRVIDLAKRLGFETVESRFGVVIMVRGEGSTPE